MQTSLVWLKKERKPILNQRVSRRESVRVRLGETGETGGQGQLMDGPTGHSEEFPLHCNGQPLEDFRAGK